MTLRKPALIYLLVVTVAASCAQGPPIASDLDLVANVISPKTGSYGALAWVDNYIVVSLLDLNAQPSDSLGQLDPGSRELTHLAISPPEDCQFPDPVAPSRLPNGQLAFALLCNENTQSPTYTIVAHDLTSGSESAIGSLTGTPLQFSMAPDMMRTVADVGGDICSGLEIVRKNAAVPLRGSVTIDGTSFDLASALTFEPDCNAVGRATLGAWSPNGVQIALFASPPVTGHTGPERLADPWALCLLPVAGGDVKVLISGVQHPRGLSWSPSGRFLAFSGDIRGLGAGSWLWDSSNQTLSRFTRSLLGFIAWSPDGKKIAAARSIPAAPVLDSADIVLFDLSRLEPS